MSKIIFLPNKIEFEIDSNESVLQLAQKKGIPIRFSCNGVPSCAECRIRVVDGEENINPPSKQEIDLIGNVSFVDSRRLACQLFCFGDVKVDLSDHLKDKDWDPANTEEPSGKDLEKASNAPSPANVSSGSGTFALDEDEE